MAINKKNDKLIRKIDTEGVNYVGRVHSLDLAPGLRMSRWLLKNASTSLVFERMGTYSRSNTNEGWVIPAGTDFPLRFKTLDIWSLGVGVVPNSDFNTFKVTKTGLYYVEAMDSVEVPIEIRPTYAYLKIKRNGYIYRILDGEPMVAIGVDSESYHHFWFLRGGTFCFFNEGDKFQVVIEFGSNAIPPGSLSNANVHTCRFSIHYVGDGWEE